MLTGGWIWVIFKIMGHVPKEFRASSKIYLTKVIGGKVFQTVVDKDTAGGGLLNTSGYSLIPDGENLGRVRGRISIECPSCGCSKEKFEESGRFGCPECYQVFGPFLSPLLRKMHKGLRHVGKIPRRRVSPEVIEARVKELRAELERMVKFENFEEAARLRDEIRGLEGYLKADL